jgi:hypothetical protein
VAQAPLVKKSGLPVKRRTPVLVRSVGRSVGRKIVQLALELNPSKCEFSEGYALVMNGVLNNVIIDRRRASESYQ